MSRKAESGTCQADATYCTANVGDATGHADVKQTLHLPSLPFAFNWSCYSLNGVVGTGHVNFSVNNCNTAQSTTVTWNTTGTDTPNGSGQYKYILALDITDGLGGDTRAYWKFTVDQVPTITINPVNPTVQPNAQTAIHGELRQHRSIRPADAGNAKLYMVRKTTGEPRKGRSAPRRAFTRRRTATASIMSAWLSGPIK